MDESRLLDYSIGTMNLMKFSLPVLFLAACTNYTTLTAEQRFKRADHDGNGSISRTEATKLMIAEAFAMSDTNQDGQITEAEFLAFGGKMENFRKVDSSGNGRISLEEAQTNPLVFNTFVVSFDEADANKDGYVTLAEYESYLEIRDAAVR